MSSWPGWLPRSDDRNVPPQNNLPDQFRISSGSRNHQTTAQQNNPGLTMYTVRLPNSGGGQAYQPH